MVLSNITSMTLEFFSQELNYYFIDKEEETLLHSMLLLLLLLVVMVREILFFSFAIGGVGEGDIVVAYITSDNDEGTIVCSNNNYCNNIEGIITCCNSTKGVITRCNNACSIEGVDACCRTTTTMALNETHPHLCSNFQRIGDKRLFVSWFHCSKKVASKVRSITSGGSICLSCWKKGGCSLIVCPQNWSVMSIPKEHWNYDYIVND